MKSCNAGVNTFFIVGCGRSGTTLLKTILNVHQDIAVTPETFFYGSIVRGERNNQLDINAKIDFVFNKWWMKDFGLDKHDVEDNLDKIICKNDWDTVFLSIMKAYANKYNVKYVGEKTPAHMSRAQYFLETFVGSKVICIFRDPRAVYNSYKKTNVGTVSVVNVINEWKNAYNMHSQIKQYDGYISVRYEDLVESPEEVIKKIIGFIGVDFDPSLLNFHERHGSGFSPEQAHHANTLKPLFNDSVHEWKKHLNKYQVGLVEERLSAEMHDIGYVSSKKHVKYLRVYEVFSYIYDFFHKAAIRKPRQILKGYLARKRHMKV